jgi:hypothetical protein
MSIFRCNKCAHLQEHPDGLIGETIACARCNHPAPVYSTVYFVTQLLKRYFDAQREIAGLKEKFVGQSGLKAPETTERTSLDGLDLANTDVLTSEAQHQPILDWFRRKQIKVQINARGVDTTGFFDEVASHIGGNLIVLKDVVERIRWAQQKEYSSTTIHLGKRSAEDAAAISTFCQQLYDYSFVAKCFYNRAENTIRLIVQTAPSIRDFFNGEWLEWHALMTCLHDAKSRKKGFACARNLTITLQNGDNHELDVFVLIEGAQPICIECKTGEYRQNIEKYLMLRKSLGINGSSFIMCVAGLGEEIAKGLSAMYDLNFTNEAALPTQLARLY